MKKILLLLTCILIFNTTSVFAETEAEVINGRAWLKVETVDGYRYVSAREGTKFWLENNWLWATDLMDVYYTEPDGTLTYEMYDRKVDLIQSQPKILTGNSDVFMSPSLLLIYWDAPLDTTYVAQPPVQVVEIPVSDDMEVILQTKLLKSIASLLTIVIFMMMLVFFFRRKNP